MCHPDRIQSERPYVMRAGSRIWHGFWDLIPWFHTARIPGPTEQTYNTVRPHRTKGSAKDLNLRGFLPAPVQIHEAQGL